MPEELVVPDGFTRRRAYRIEDCALVVTTITGDGTRGSTPASIPMRDIVAVHLTHAPARFNPDRFRCRLSTRAGVVHTLTNVGTHASIAAENINAQYSAFIGNLCASVAKANPAARFLRGRSHAMMIAEFFGLLLLGLALIGAWVWFRPRNPWMLVMSLALCAVYLPLAAISNRANRPGNFDPLAVPPELVPRQAE